MSSPARRLRSLVARTRATTPSPRSRSWRARWEPRNPVAPVISARTEPRSGVHLGALGLTGEEAVAERPGLLERRARLGLALVVGDVGEGQEGGDRLVEVP